MQRGGWYVFRRDQKAGERYQIYVWVDGINIIINLAVLSHGWSVTGGQDTEDRDALITLIVWLSPDYYLYVHCSVATRNNREYKSAILCEL